MAERIWTTGGAGGQRAVTEDLEWAVAVLRAAASDVASAKSELARRRAALALDPGVGHAGLAADLAYAANSRVAGVGDDLEDTARRLAAAAAAYLEAESGARFALGLWEHGKEVVADAVGGTLWAGRIALWLAGSGVPIPNPLALRRDRPTALPPTTGYLNRASVQAALDLEHYERFAAALAIALRACEMANLEPQVANVEGRGVSAEPVRSVEDVMRRLLDAQQAGGGAVRIERWTDAAGVTHRIVFIPGTTDWLTWAANPADIQADAALMARYTTEYEQVVRDALAADGAQPGDSVMLAGHSLGGIVATALAASPTFRQQVGVNAILTAGSPTGRIDLPASVRALHLEGTRDIVPGLDGRANPDTPTRVTVHHDARRSELTELEGEGRDLSSAHHLDTYAQTARLVDEGLTQSTDAWLEANHAYFETGVDVAVTEYHPVPDKPW